VTADGDLVGWRDGTPELLARLGDARPERALETAYGIVLLNSREGTLVRPDGRVDRFGADLQPGAALSEDGRYLAVEELRHGRRSWQRLHVVDLADCSLRTMPWDGDGGLWVTAMHGGVVYFLGGGGASPASMRWRPGSEPEALPYRLESVDAISGAALAYDGEPGVVVIRPDGSRHRVPVNPPVALAPGAERLYAYRYMPPAVTFYEVATGADQPRIHWLPRHSEVSTTVPSRPVWEDADHLLVLLDAPTPELDAPAVRLDVRTGAFERVPLTGDAGYRPMLVEPMALGRVSRPPDRWTA
jgi:hypothetical protein